MDVNEAQTLAHYLMAKHLDTDVWQFKWSNGVKLFGYCCHQDKTISLSLTMTELNELAKVRDTILHEIAHAMCGPGVGHGYEWKRTARAIGCSARRCYTPDTVNPPAPWLAVCPYACGFSVLRHRRRQSACPDCCNKYNGGLYSIRYLLRYIPNVQPESEIESGVVMAERMTR